MRIPPRLAWRRTNIPILGIRPLRAADAADGAPGSADVAVPGLLKRLPVVLQLLQGWADVQGLHRLRVASYVAAGALVDGQDGVDGS